MRWIGRDSLSGHLDDRLHVGVPRCNTPFRTDRGQTDRRDRELGRAGVDPLIGQCGCRRVRPLCVRGPGLDRQRCERDVTNLACGTSYLIALDAADAAGNRSARVESFLKTSPCPTTNKAPSAPTGLKVTSSTPTSMALAWSPSTDDVAVAGYGLYVSGQRTTDTTKTSADFTGLQCGTTYTMGIDAFDTPGKRSTVTELSAATSPCPSAPAAPDAGTAAGTSSGTATGTTTTEPATATAAKAPSTPGGSLTQTIVGGSTLSGQVNWRAVYDRNGDGVSDDPGSMRFYVDSTLVLTEQSRPFGDTPGFWKSSSVADGRHTFEVRAIGRWGTVLATNTVTASVANAAPNPQSTDTTAPTVAATAPTNGATVSGMVNQAVNATDNVGVTKVEFLRDGVMYGTDSTAPYSASLNTTTVPNGSHTLGHAHTTRRAIWEPQRT